MTTDRELLELAAKAAGKSIKWDSVEGCWYVETEDYPGNPEWNPLTDDGDALRLAAKLWIDVTYWPDAYVTCVYPEEPMDTEDIAEPLGNDPYAATRRAIVRAAAAIGKEK